MRASSRNILSVLSAVAIVAVFGLCALAQDNTGIEQQKKKRDALERDIQILHKQLSEVTKRNTDALTAISLLQAQEKLRKKVIADTDEKIRSYNRQITATTREIARQQAVLDTLEAHYDRLIAGAYKNRDVKKWYMYILSSDNVSQAYRRFGYFKSLSGRIKANARQIEDVKASLNSKKSELLSLRKAADKFKAGKTSELRKLQADEAMQKTLVKSLKKSSKSYKAALAAKKKEMSAIDRKIAQMLREASRGAGKKGGAAEKKYDKALAERFEKSKGKLPWPVEGPVTEHFGPYRNTQLKLSLVNNGINIACEKGSPVKAVFDGVVSNVMLAPGYGQCILIQHGDYYTSYCKVKDAYVHQGDKVTAGQTIGEVATVMGKTQLYFLIYKKKYLNPEDWLSR